jgi:pimeloyl-ACP methyl ester carboxylesterase
MDDVAAPAADTKKWREMKASGARGKEFCEADAKVFRYVLVGNRAHGSRIQSHCDLPNEWPENTDKHFAHLFASINALNITPADLAKIAMPALVIHGTKDRNAPYGSGREWAMSLPDARLVTVDGAAHVSWADDPIVVFGSIREFLRGNWPMTAEKVTVLDPQP